MMHNTIGRQALSPLSPNRREENAGALKMKDGVFTGGKTSAKLISKSEVKNVSKSGSLTPKSARKTPLKTGSGIVRQLHTPIPIHIDVKEKQAEANTRTNTVINCDVENKENAKQMFQISSEDRFMNKAVGTPTPPRTPFALPLPLPHTAAIESKVSDVDEIAKEIKGSSVELAPNAYEVVFPPGPMGLELEPVIISATKQIGCRVRDFYFPVEFDHVLRERITGNVRTGDVMSHVNGESVLSLPFQDVLTQLREQRATTRVVVFKNITFSALSQPKIENPFESLHANDKSIVDEKAKQKETGPSSSSPAALMRGLVATKELSKVSPTGWKIYPGTPITSIIKPDVVSPEESVAVESTVTAQVRTTVTVAGNKDKETFISPSAIRALRYDATAEDFASYYYHTASNNSTASPGAVVISTEHGRPTEVSDLGKVWQSMGATLGGAIEGITSVVGDKILGVGNRPSITPQQQIDHLVAMKHELITELSKSCVMLGAAEDARTDLKEQLECARDQQLMLRKEIFLLEERNTALLIKLEGASLYTEVDDEQRAQMEQQLSTLNAAVAKNDGHAQDMRRELDSERGLHLMWKEKHNDLHTMHQELQMQSVHNFEEMRVQLSAKEEELLLTKTRAHNIGEQLAALEMERASERASWEADMDTMAQEQATLREEMETTFRSAAESLAAVELQRDTLQTEVEVLRDVGTSELNVKTGEVSRLKAALTALREDSNNALRKSEEAAETALSQLRAELTTSMTEKNTALGSRDAQYQESEKKREALTYELSATSARIVDLEQKCLTLQTSVNTWKDQFDAATTEIGQLKTQQQEDEDSLQEYRERVHQAENELAEKILLHSSATLASYNNEEQLRQALLEASDLAVSIQCKFDAAVKEHTANADGLRHTMNQCEKQYGVALVECQAVIDGLQADCKMLGDKILQTEQRVLEQSTQLEEREEHTKFAKKQIATLEEELRRVQDQAQEDLSAANAKLLVLLSDANATELRLHTLDAQRMDVMKERDVKLAAAEDEAAVQRGNILDLETRLDGAIFAYETCRIDLVDAQRSASTESQQVSQKLEESLAALAEAEKNIHELENKLVAMTSERDTVIEVSDSQHVEASAFAEVMKRQLFELAESFDATQKSLVSMRSEVADMRSAAESTAKEYSAGMQSLTHDITSKFQKKINEVRCEMTAQGVEAEQSQEALRMQISSLEAQNALEIVHATSKAQQLLDQTFARAVEAERLLQTAFDEQVELREHIRVSELAEHNAMEQYQHRLHDVQIKQESIEGLQSALEEQRVLYQDVQYSFLQLRSEYGLVCDDAEALKKEVDAMAPWRVSAEKAQEQLQSVTRQLGTVIRERDEMGKHSKQLACAHEDVKREVHRLLASQEEMIAEFDTERTGMREEAVRAEEHWQMIAEAQLANQLRVFDTQLKEAIARHDETMSAANQDFIGRLETLDAKLHDKHGQLKSRSKELDEYKKYIVPTLQSELKDISAEHSSLRSKYKGLETIFAENTIALQSATQKHTQELCSATEEFGEREQALLRQRTELLESLQAQHETLSATIKDREDAAEALRGNVQELEVYISGQKDARRQDENEAREAAADYESRIDRLTNELANLHAQINRMLHSAEAKTSGVGLSSSDLAAKLEHTLAQTNAMLATSTSELKSVKAANVALVNTTEQQAGLLDEVTEKARVLEQQLSENDEMQLQQQVLIARQQDTLKKVFAEQNAVIEKRCAETSQAMQHRHLKVISEKEAALKEVSMSMAAARSEALQLKQSVLNKEAELKALRGQCADMATAMETSGARRPLGEITIEDNVAADSSLSEDVIVLNARQSSVNDDTEPWHEHLLILSLDLHEALTFAILQLRSEGVPSESDVGKCLTAASLCTQALHSHVVRAPWIALDGSALAPSLPAAHEMLSALDSPADNNEGGDENAFPKVSFSVSTSNMTALAGSVRANTDVLLNSQLIRRLSEATHHGERQTRDLWHAHKVINELQNRAQCGAAAFSGTRNSSERVYLLLEELVSEFDSTMANDDERTGAVGGNSSDDNNSTNVSVSFETDRVMWRSLQNIAQQALTNYSTRVFARATSESNTADRTGAAVQDDLQAVDIPSTSSSSASSAVFSESTNLSENAAPRTRVSAFTKPLTIRATYPSSTMAVGGLTAQQASDRRENGDSVLSGSVSSPLYNLTNQGEMRRPSTRMHASKQSNVASDLSLEDIVAQAEQDSFGGYNADDRVRERERDVDGENETAVGDESEFWNLSADNINVTDVLEVDSSTDSLDIEAIDMRRHNDF